MDGLWVSDRDAEESAGVVAHEVSGALRVHAFGVPVVILGFGESFGVWVVGAEEHSVPADAADDVFDGAFPEGADPDVAAEHLQGCSSKAWGILAYMLSKSSNS